MDRHCYKYLVKTVHRVFFPLLALLEFPDCKAGDRLVAQRKLLFTEKLFASLLLGAPRLKNQLNSRAAELRAASTSPDFSDANRLLLKYLTALQSLLFFYLPAVFRLGYKVRSCTWEGREVGSGVWAREIMEQTFLLLLHLLKDADCKNEYVRTLSVALVTWQPWMSRIPAVCFVEESCEALLSRMGHRCDVYRTLHGFDNTLDLFLTLPPPKRGLKATRGMLKQGLVQEFAQRIRKLVFSDGESIFYAASVRPGEMHSTVMTTVPSDFEFVEAFPDSMTPKDLEFTLRRALRTLTGKRRVNDNVLDFFENMIPKKDLSEKLAGDRIFADQISWFKAHRKSLVVSLNCQSMNAFFYKRNHTKLIKLFKYWKGKYF